METISTVADIRRFSRELRCSGRRVALVPTMGALHAGHLALVREGLERADDVIASIFVNPTQFGPGEDFDRYPRPLNNDLAKLRDAGVTCAFVPDVSEMYPRGANGLGVHFCIEGLNDRLCGRYRPGHFEGVAQIVAKLFTATEPHLAVFGLKDAQQFVVINHLVEFLGLGIEIAGVETVRESDGLAMSSRNQYLSAEQRLQASVLSRAVLSARDAIRRGELHPEGLVTAMLHQLGQAPDLDVQYAEIVDADTLGPVDAIAPGQRVLIAAAGFLGPTRLIDSSFVTSPRKGATSRSSR